MYDGRWRGGKKHGWGCERYANGDVYEGEFTAGEREAGVVKHADGSADKVVWQTVAQRLYLSARLTKK